MKKNKLAKQPWNGLMTLGLDETRIKVSALDERFDRKDSATRAAIKATLPRRDAAQAPRHAGPPQARRDCKPKAPVDF